MRTLIINLGPAGDVLRTTVLLRELEGEIFWLTKRSSADVLNSKRISKVCFIDDENGMKSLKETPFDVIISLNEEKDALEALQRLKTKKVIGIYLNKEGTLRYTQESAYWFDMSLSSRFGKKRADELKMENTKPLPQILIEMIGKKWRGQEYDLGIEPKEVKGRIGLININAGLWPNKGWSGYENLAKMLEKDGLNVIFLKMRPTIRDHIEDINNCEVIVCGDTLGMHIALALRKKVIALFNCTSPQEIYSYKRMEKIISPVCKKHFYQKAFSEEAVRAIKPKKVYLAVKKALKS